MSIKPNLKNNKNFWIYICMGVAMLFAGLILAPIWSKTEVFFKNWGGQMVDIMIAVSIAVYVILYLSKKIKRSNNATIQLIVVAELVLLSVIALGCVLSQFDVISVGGPCEILGLALWCRGTAELFRAYYYRRESSVRYPAWYVAVAVGMVTFGTYIFAKPFFTELHLRWIFCSAIILAGILMIVYGIIVKPKKS